MTPFDQSKRILVLGDCYVDAHLDHGLVRLGGVFHAARALHAAGITYAVAYAAPSYLRENIENYLARLQCSVVRQVAEVTGAPNVVLIRRSSEAGDIGYDDMLRDARRTQSDPGALQQLVSDFVPTDVLIFPGSFPLSEAAEVAKRAGARVHIDGQYLDDLTSALADVPVLDTLFISAPCSALARSSRPSDLWDSVRNTVQRLVLKENRGGSRVINLEGEAHAPAFPTSTIHSIGVGDCFDALVVASREEPASLSLRRASYYAAQYASTFDHDAFGTDVATAMSSDTEVLSLVGTRLRWEDRPNQHIYLAAPDFPHIDCRSLVALEEALKYHNFTPHRPIQENGLADGDRNPARDKALFRADVELLERCTLLIAVPLTPDPGTYAELGYFSAKGRPSILYEVNGAEPNLFARYSATRCCGSLTTVIDAVFELLGRT